METDASSTACAGILSLKWEDGWHPIAYCSKKFTGPEIHYPIYDKELFAIVWSFKQWRHYLEGAPGIEVWSDHENLKQFMAQPQLNGRQARWLIKLAPYDFTIHYRKGVLNPADGPSRRPDYMEDNDPPDTAVARLMPTLRNKLATDSRGADEQSGVQGSEPCAESLIRALSLQVVTRSAARRVTSRSDSLENAVVSQEGATLYENVHLDTHDLVREGKASERQEHMVREGAASERLEHMVREGTASERLDSSSAPNGSNSSDDDEALAPARSLVQMIRNAQEFDPQCRRIISQLRGHSQYGPSLALVPQGMLQHYSVDEDRLLRHDRRVLVPAQEALKAQLLEIYHDSPSGGHFGRDKTLERIRRQFTWPGITEDVREYVATCPVCQGKAVHRHKPYGQLQPLPIPTDLWNSPFKEISLDWITGLPVSIRNGQEFDSILTIVCRVTKYALFLPTREDSTAVDFAQLFFEHVECCFGSPRGIVTDRDSRITSEFWQEVCDTQIIKRYMSTTYHHQTDGQSEALDRIIEDYLRANNTEDPTAWTRLLPLAQFAYNNSRNHTTRMSPNRLLHGFNCEIRMDVADNVPERRITAAKDRVEKLHQLHETLRGRLIDAHERMSRYYNAKHVPKQFRVREFVKLSIENLRFKHRKLAPRWFGPFRELERIGG
jgi:hypothetical protein